MKVQSEGSSRILFASKVTMSEYFLGSCPLSKGILISGDGKNENEKGAEKERTDVNSMDYGHEDMYKENKEIHM